MLMSCEKLGNTRIMLSARFRVKFAKSMERIHKRLFSQPPQLALQRPFQADGWLFCTRDYRPKTFS